MDGSPYKSALTVTTLERYDLTDSKIMLLQLYKLEFVLNVLILKPFGYGEFRLPRTPVIFA